MKNKLNTARTVRADVPAHMPTDRTAQTAGLTREELRLIVLEQIG